MKKVIICLTGCLLALATLRAQPPDTTRQVPPPATARLAPIPYTQANDTAMQTKDTAVQVKDTVIQVKDTAIQQVKDTSARMMDTSIRSKGVAVQVKGNNIHVFNTADSVKTDSARSNSTASVKDAPAKDASMQTKDPDAEKVKDADASQTMSSGRTVDRRWFISPLLKFQFQDFAFLEKNRKGYLSDANTLPFFKRGNASFAASAYKNLTGRLSISADIGLSFGHVTNDNELISQTQSKTYNLLNAALYYHLLPASYRLQPYVTVGINDIINDASYVSAPVGIGAKFNAKKIMVMGQITYGASVSKNISNTTMYSMGIYIPIKNKKQKQQDEEDKSAYNKKKDKDSTSKNGQVNNIYITINVDSLLKARGLDGNNGNNGNGSGGNRRKGNGNDNGNDDGDDNGSDGQNADGSSSDGSVSGSSGKHRKKKNSLHSFNFDDFRKEDYKVDTIDGVPVIRFIVYFEFNEYSLNSNAFASIDRVISHLAAKPNLAIEIKGYTDDVGTEQYNNFLSRRRAKQVLDYMNSRGVPSELMQAKAYGSDSPVADNKDPDQAWLNRRAEIIVHEK